MPARKKTGRIKRKSRPLSSGEATEEGPGKNSTDSPPQETDDKAVVEDPPESYLSLADEDQKLLLQYAGLDSEEHPVEAQELVVGVDNVVHSTTFDHLIPTSTESRKVLTEIQKAAKQLHELLRNNPRVVDWHLPKEDDLLGPIFRFSVTLVRVQTLANDALERLSEEPNRRGKIKRAAAERDYCIDELVRVFQNLDHGTEADQRERCVQFVAVALRAGGRATESIARLAECHHAEIPSANDSRFVSGIHRRLNRRGS